MTETLGRHAAGAPEAPAEDEPPWWALAPWYNRQHIIFAQRGDEPLMNDYPFCFCQTAKQAEFIVSDHNTMQALAVVAIRKQPPRRLRYSAEDEKMLLDLVNADLNADESEDKMFAVFMDDPNAAEDADPLDKIFFEPVYTRAAAKDFLAEKSAEYGQVPFRSMICRKFVDVHGEECSTRVSTGGDPGPCRCRGSWKVID